MRRRRNLGFRPRKSPVKTAAHANVSALTATLVSEGMATMDELDRVYSYEDALNLHEIVMVKYENRARANDHRTRQAGTRI